MMTKKVMPDWIPRAPNFCMLCMKVRWEPGVH